LGSQARLGYRRLALTTRRTAERAAEAVPGVRHAHAKARWAGRSLVVDLEGWVDPHMDVQGAYGLGREVIAAVANSLPEARRVTWQVRPHLACRSEGGKSAA